MKMIVAAVVALLALGSERATAACLAPNPQLLLGERPIGCCHVLSHWTKDRRSNHRWIAVSWDGPPDGNLYIVDCAGRKVAEIGSLGYIVRMHSAPSIGGSPTAAVTYVAGSGTNVRVRAVALVQFRDERIRVLWRHLMLDAAFPPLTPVRMSDRTSWRLSQDRTRIIAMTTRLEGAKLRRPRKVDVERYCFREDVWRYLPCQ